MNTLTSIFCEQSGNPISKNFPFYLDCLERAHGLKEITKPRDIILLAKKSGTELFSLFMGAILSGRIPLIIQRPSPKVHQSFFEKRMTDLKNQIGEVLCFCEETDKDKFSPFFKCVTSLITGKTSEDIIFNDIKEDDFAFYQMSSGTTGISKLCKITHNQVIDHCRNYGKRIGMNRNKSVISWLPLYHDMGLIAAFLLPIVYDAQFHIIDPFDWLINPTVFLKEITNYKGTHCWMPSFAFNYHSNKITPSMMEGIDLNSLERVISCSEPTFVDDLNKFKQIFSPVGLKPETVCVCYALAENTFAVSQSDTLEELEWKGINYTNCGKPLPNVNVDIRKDNKSVKEIDDGTIWIKSPWMPITNKITEDGWYNTGDIGFIKNGNLYVIGREKDMFISFGVNIYPEIIEHSVSNIEGIIPGRVVCFGDFSKSLGTNKIVLLAETENIKNNKLKIEISSIIREEFNVTAIVELVEPGSLIKTSSGKFCRIKNKEQYAKHNVKFS